MEKNRIETTRERKFKELEDDVAMNGYDKTKKYCPSCPAFDDSHFMNCVECCPIEKGIVRFIEKNPRDDHE